VKCRAANCDFEGTQDEVDDHFVDCIRIGDPGHARMPQGPLPQNLPPKCTCGAGDTTPSLDSDGYSLHQEDCPRAYRKPRRREVRIGDKIRIRIVNGKPAVFIDGKLVPEDRITQAWGTCRCAQSTRARVWHYPGPNHQTSCPRYRREPFGSTK
jgi:hypothetical protein